MISREKIVVLKSNAQKFWNNPKNITWFGDEPAPRYWKRFFKQGKKLGINRVLDLGCGSGRNTQLLMELGYDFYGCDLYGKMVETTISRLIKNDFPQKEAEFRIIKASMLNLPYKKRFFDTILSNGIYHNLYSIEELEMTIKESTRVLQPNGFICFNLFSSRYIPPELKKLDKFTYVTREGLAMVLVSKKQFLALTSKNGLYLYNNVIEYEREIPTGRRAVMRGILQKKG